MRTPFVSSIFDPEPRHDLEAYVRAGGGAGLAAARRVEPEAIIEEVAASGLRGRGGAGFPTGRKWRTVRAAVPPGQPVPVVVNAAEGEPGTFKDRMLIRHNPYRVLEGALIAARAVGADEVTIAVKASFEQETRRLSEAIQEIEAAGWADGVRIVLHGGPPAYLFGEETGLLEVLEGRQPFPRVAPPYRRGFDEAAREPDSGTARASVEEVEADVPSVVDNVETLANVPSIIADGAAAFRRLGTEDTPGTLLCTISGDTLHHGVAEVPAGTPLREVVDAIGEGLDEGRSILGVLCGVSGPLIPASLLDTPLSHSAMAEVGLTLGSAGFIVVDDSRDPVAVAHGVSKFLAVESCGQCEPCKRDGLALSGALDVLARGAGHERRAERPLAMVRDRLSTVADNARCNLARQQEAVVGSILALFGDAFRAHAEGRAESAEVYEVLPIVDIVDGRAVLDESERTKQPDWSHDPVGSGAWPAQRLEDTPVDVRVPDPTGTDAIGIGIGRTEPPLPTGDPLAPVEQAHEAIDELFRRVAEHPGDGALRDELADSLHELADVSTRIVTPMARRFAGAPGDDAAWAVEGHDRSMMASVDQLRDGPTSMGPDEIRELADDYHRHVELEDSILDMLRDVVDRRRLEDIAAAFEEAFLEAEEATESAPGHR
jgi:NADH:ubiquinone oxidoreductase subunit F (NADH-binding)